MLAVVPRIFGPVLLGVEDIPYRFLRPECFDRWSHVVRFNQDAINAAFQNYFVGPFLRTQYATLSIDSEPWQKYAVTCFSNFRYYLLFACPAVNLLWVVIVTKKPSKSLESAFQIIPIFGNVTCFCFSNAKRFESSLMLEGTDPFTYLPNCIKTVKFQTVFKGNRQS